VEAATAKPTVFISHAATDEPIVRVLHDEINRVFAYGVDVFATSVPGVVQPGSEWLEGINEKLGRASAVIVVVTPVSLDPPFIWFEVGASDEAGPRSHPASLRSRGRQSRSA
jgi:TIR domain